MKETTSTNSRRRYAALAAAAGVLVAGAAVAFAAQGGGGSTKQASPTTSVTDGGPISPGGGAIGSCVEMYNLTNLAHREVAFDGVVQNVDGDTITFSVNHWFRGGSESTTTRKGAAVLGGMTSAGPGASLAQGTRLLVAGDGEFAWSCGFTQAWSADVASQWASAFAGG